MWNAVIVFEGCEITPSATEALVKVRHVAADCMYMSTTVLGGISARYNIDDLSLLKFYTACGQKYATELSDMEMADVCFSKAAEFVTPALNESKNGDGDTKMFVSAMFDLLIGRAECAWEKGESDQAEVFVSDASKYIDELPNEHEFLASVEYNFGLFAYQSKETERALKWLKRSMKTRETDANLSKDMKKQAKTARLAGVCLLALQEYEESWKMMNMAEEISHDPVGSYLLLKLSVITRKGDALDVLVKTIEDTEISLEVCMSSVALFGDAQRVGDAAIGFERVFERYKDDHQAIVSIIGPRYFETLVALGNIEKAMRVLDACCFSLENLTQNAIDTEQDPQERDMEDSTLDLSMQFSRWSALLLTTGSGQADRKDFSSAAKLLSRCLHFARNSTARLNAGNGRSSMEKSTSKTSNVVTENEAAVCRLAASCALCSLDEQSRKSQVAFDIDSRKGQAGQDKAMQAEMLEMSIVHAKRAKLLESSDFAPRLLLFRAYLFANDFEKAAFELRQASSEIRSFDPGALAEAACAARDIGSTSSVVAALRCILSMDPSLLQTSFSSSAASCPKGFFGKVLLSCVHILLDEEKQVPALEAESRLKNLSLTESTQQPMGNADLLNVLECGLRGVETLGLETAFDNQGQSIQNSTSYLMNVCWNKGREHGKAMQYELWEAYFDKCYRYSNYLLSDAETLHTRRMSKLMCASATIENPDSKSPDFLRGRDHVVEARRLSMKLQELSPCVRDDPIEGLLFILESRCCVGSEDMDALHCVIETALQNQTISAAVFEQLAAVCYNARAQKDRSEERVRCMDLTAALLSKAGDCRLCDGQRDLGALAVTMREHLGIELSRGSTPARAFQVFMKTIGVVNEHSSDFPMDERRWLVAVGWDRAQMLKRTGRDAEARRWCNGAKQLAEGCLALSTYIPRLDTLLGKLSAI